MSDALFTTHKHEIILDKFNEDFFIPVFSDVHRYAYNCDVNGWMRFLDYCKRLQKDNPGRVMYLGLGDYDDLGSESERRKLMHSEFHDTTYDSLDDYMDNRTKQFSDEIAFMKGKTIGLVEGNHHYRFASGDTSTMRLCKYLGTKYLGGISIIRLDFVYKGNKGGKRATVDIYAHHTAGSKGGGRKAGSSLNKLEEMSEVWDVDITIAGHDHKMNAGFPVRMFLDKHMNVKQRDILLVRTGSFQKGWIPGKAGYVPTFNGKPNFLGCPVIKLTPTRTYDNASKDLKETVFIKKSILMGAYF